MKFTSFLPRFLIGAAILAASSLAVFGIMYKLYTTEPYSPLEDSATAQAAQAYAEGVREAISGEIFQCVVLHGLVPAFGQKLVFQSGTAQLNIIINSQGQPTEFKVKKSTLDSEVLEVLKSCVTANVFKKEFVEPAFTTGNTVVSFSFSTPIKRR